jgi:rubrerythrin
MTKELQISDFTNIPQALNVALEREKRAHDFYVQGAQRVEDAGVKTLFSELAAEEKNHIIRIQAMIDKEIMQDM